ncbi:ProP effector [Orbus hercynius]|uniref:RNA chaperone ProQ n=1 Tax=Orbus hercynius TaxID=593135 RepID=A0A495RBR8_9GAMM|nr:RNA chaperone ProQ [Orbus hercynius]RKS84716.1 ProP effector [Orbus hercynius]
MDKQPELKSSKEVIVYLSNRFPQCFSIEGEAKPLKVGIFQDLAERLADDEQLSKTKLRSVLRSYTASWRYLYCLKTGANRVDLDGQPCEVITPEQAEHAQAQLKESKEKAKANRKTVEKDKPSRVNMPKLKHERERVNTSPKAVIKKNSSKISQPVDITALQTGCAVKVMLGSKAVLAVISSIDKERIKVKVSSGMELSVTSDHIVL